jgi:hypothetical protein
MAMLYTLFIVSICRLLHTVLTDRVFRTNGGEKKCIQNFGWITNGTQKETGWIVLTGFLASSG